MQIQPVNNLQNSFKAISTIWIPSSSTNPQKLLVQVEHKGDFSALKWHKVVVNTLEKGKKVATEIFENKKSFMSLEEIAKINEYIDNKAGVPKDKLGCIGVLMNAFFEQQMLEK